MCFDLGGWSGLIFWWCTACRVLVTFRKGANGRRRRLRIKALFTSIQKPKNFPSHRIFRRMYGVLNIDENKTNCIV